MDAASPADRGTVDTRLVEYALVALPRAAGVAPVLDAVADIVRAGAVRLLDSAVVALDDRGAVTIDELAADDVERVGGSEPPGGMLLSRRDLELIAEAVPPGELGLVLMMEDRWAVPLAEAAERAGGRFLAGERIPPARLAAILGDRPWEEER